jgi:hypothetical protein
MGTWVSKRGQWVPAREENVAVENKTGRVLEVNGKKIQPGEKFIYDGPDREAMLALHKEGVEHLGQDFKTDPEFLQAVRNKGFDSVEEYLKVVGYDEEKYDKEFETKAYQMKAHEFPKRVKEVVSLGGGKDMSGAGNHIPGGFGDYQKAI